MSHQLVLVPSLGGWALVTPDGEFVYESLRPDGRRRCLEFASEHGVLALHT